MDATKPQDSTQVWSTPCVQEVPVAVTMKGSGTVAESNPMNTANKVGS